MPPGGGGVGVGGGEGGYILIFILKRSYASLVDFPLLANPLPEMCICF